MTIEAECLAPILWRIALPLPLYRLFDYLPPEGAERINPQPGMRVWVPFGSQTRMGFWVAEVADGDRPLAQYKPVLSVIDDQSLFDPALWALCEFAADYYCHSLGETLAAALPQRLRDGEPVPQQPVWSLTLAGKALSLKHFRRSLQQGRAWQSLLQAFEAGQAGLTADAVRASALAPASLKALEKKGLAEVRWLHLQASNRIEPLSAPIEHDTPKTLNAEQARALAAVTLGQFGAYLLEGVTGSGKTEVYLQLMAEVLAQGQQVLLLVPEIGLAPQTLARLEARFAVHIAQLHSSVAKGMRLADWRSAQLGEAKIVIGTRLAVFTPMPHLGLIIIDEEHDLSFKQQDGLRYHARDLAIWRARQAAIPVLLGSATPSLETLHNAKSGRYHWLVLSQPAEALAQPKWTLVDMRKQEARAGIAPPVWEAIAATLKQGEQVLIFLNRRGYAPALLCRSCGWAADCASCSARMTWHKQAGRLICHQCGAHRVVPRHCPQCLNPALTAIGQGTEQAEDALQAAFPAVPVVRVDRDSMQSVSARSAWRATMEREQPCVLVGTQMLAKGHHFPLVTLVVVVDADQGLLSGDFRGLERMGQLLVQVAGRAGRAERPGQVWLQSFNPDHPLLNTVLSQGYPTFAEQLLALRHQAALPPYRYWALLRAEARQSHQALRFLQDAQAHFERVLAGSNASCLGPIPALIEKRQDRYRFQLQLSFDERHQRNQVLKRWLETQPQKTGVRWALDIDPMETA
jgi:primosomal protein N' (replication factor Y) (superfamily II helicase)